MKKTGLKDIANHLGVSIALVSYVLNGQAEEKQVNKETAERIISAAEALHYQPNQIARSLKTKKTHTIGLVVADINYRFSTGITRAIEDEAKQNNYTVIYGSSNEREDKFAELVNVLVSRRVDGLILVPTEHSEAQIRTLQRMEVPFVLVDRNFPGIKTNYVALDNYKAAYTATEYLIAAGHQRIAMVNYETDMFHLHERNRGYRDALKAHQLPFRKQWLQEVRNDVQRDEGIRAAIDTVCNLPKPCDALFFATDTLALDGLKYLNKVHKRVPEDISVLSFDESDAFELFYTAITHSKQPLEEMGKLAVETLLELIDQRKINKQISLEATLVKGKSCREL